MSKTTEQKLVVSANEGSKITRVDVNIADDGTIVEIDIISNVAEEPISKTNTEEQVMEASAYFINYNIDEIFPIVEASKLSLEDEFLQHQPKTEEQERLKKSIVAGIKGGLTDFRHHTMDASEDKDGNIFFEERNKPAVGHSANWWNEKAENFIPGKNSRLGTKQQYDAFLGVLIKYLVEEQLYEISEAWTAVCNNSKKLGHYCDSVNSKKDYEATGKRRVGKWFDLANTCKIIKQDEHSSFLMAGGSYFDYGCYYPLADICPITDFESTIGNSTGWIVLDV